MISVFGLVVIIFIESIHTFTLCFMLDTSVVGEFRASFDGASLPYVTQLSMAWNSLFQIFCVTSSPSKED